MKHTTQLHTRTHTYSTYPILWKDVVIVVTLYVSRFYYPLLMIRHQREVPPNFTLVTISAWFFLPHDGVALKERGIGRNRLKLKSAFEWDIVGAVNISVFFS